MRSLFVAASVCGPSVQPGTGAGCLYGRHDRRAHRPAGQHLCAGCRCACASISTASTRPAASTARRSTSSSRTTRREPSKAAANAKKLLTQDNVVLMLNASLSSTYAPVVAEAKRAGVPLLFASSVCPKEVYPPATAAVLHHGFRLDL